MHCGIQNIIGVFLTMQSFVKWADVASPRFHKIPLASWGPFSDLHCCMQKPARWRQSTLETFKRLQTTAGFQEDHFTWPASISHGVHPSGFAAAMTLCIAQHLPWNMSFRSFIWGTKSFANVFQLLNSSQAETRRILPWFGKQQLLVNILDKAVCRKPCFSQATQRELLKINFPFKNDEVK